MQIDKYIKFEGDEIVCPHEIIRVDKNGNIITKGFSNHFISTPVYRIFNYKGEFIDESSHLIIAYTDKIIIKLIHGLNFSSYYIFNKGYLKEYELEVTEEKISRSVENTQGLINSCNGYDLYVEDLYPHIYKDGNEIKFTKKVKEKFFFDTDGVGIDYRLYQAANNYTNIQNVEMGYVLTYINKSLEEITEEIEDENKLLERLQVLNLPPFSNNKGIEAKLLKLSRNK